MIHRSPKPIQMEWHLLRMVWAAPGRKKKRDKNITTSTVSFLMRKFPNKVLHWTDMLDCKSVSGATLFSGQKISLIDKRAGIADMKFISLKKGWDQRHQKDLYNTYTLNTTCICWLLLALRLYQHLFYFQRPLSRYVSVAHCLASPHKCGFSKTMWITVRSCQHQTTKQRIDLKLQ